MALPRQRKKSRARPRPKSKAEPAPPPAAVRHERAPLLVLSSDTGLAGKIVELAMAEGMEVHNVPLAGFGPGTAVQRKAAAVVDSRSYFGIAQSVVKSLHEINPGLPILAVVSDGERGKSRRDMLYGAGATLCISEGAGDEVLGESIRLLTRMTQMTDRMQHLEDLLRSRDEELSTLRREMDESQSQLAKRVQEQMTVYRAARAMLRIFNFDDLANEIVRLATIELGAEVGSLMLIEGEDLVVRALYGHIPGEDPIMGRRQKVGEGISGWVAREGKPLLIRDIDQTPQFRERGGVRYKTKSSVSSPIISRGMIRGVINITNKKTGGHFTEDDLRLLRTLSMTAAVALHNFELREQARRSENMSSIGELATRMAHEIRNPLHAIKMNIQILGKKFPLDSDDQEYYDILLGEIGRLENLVREVLSFARPEKPNFVSCDLNRLVERTTAVLKSLFDEKNIELVYEPARDLPLVSVDEEKIEQAIMNLVINAVEAMTGGGKIQISTGEVVPFMYPRSHYGEEITERPQDEYRYAVVTIKDNGVGIEQRHYDKMFNPFFTTKANGTGLGLSTTRKIIEAHAGKLYFYSELNEGTTFKIQLPVADDFTKEDDDFQGDAALGR